MKYYSSIATLFFLSFLFILSLLYLGNISREFEKDNISLKKEISNITELVNINEIEFNLYNNYDYLKKLQKIYFTESANTLLYNRISFNNFKNKNLDTVHIIGTK
jgi:hypothetical protein